MYSEKNLYKVYRDSSGHYTARAIPPYKKRERTVLPKTDKEEYFYFLYISCLPTCKKREKQFPYIYDGMVSAFGVFDGIREFINENLDNVYKCIHGRKNRFIRKLHLNKWNYFVTITYDNNLFDTEEEFRNKLKHTLSNFHTRRGWKYMGAFEKSPEERRLHFHAVMYIPDGEMAGTLEEKTEYSTKKKRMQTIIQNTFFAKFGRNYFQSMSEKELEVRGSYIMKYTTKDSEKIFYSRGTPEFLEQEFSQEELSDGCDYYGTIYIVLNNVTSDDDLAESPGLEDFPMLC